MLDITITDMQLAHISDIASLEEQCFGKRAWSADLLEAEFRDSSKHYKVATLRGKVIGYGGFSHILDEAHIMNIAVGSPYRQMGVGSLIMHALKQKALSFNIRSLTLEVSEFNLPAIQFYKKHDFISSGIRPRYYSDKEGAQILWCLLEE